MIVESKDRDLVFSMATAIAPRLSEWYGEGSTIDLSNISFSTYPYSYFIGFPVKTGFRQQTLLAKIKRKPGLETIEDAISAENLKLQAKEEYVSSQKVWRAFEAENSPTCIAVQPFDYYERWNAILMRKVEGKALKDFLLRPAVTFRAPQAMEQLLELLASSARWLRIFHDRAAELEIVPYPMEKVQLDMMESLSNLRKYSGRQMDINPYQRALQKGLEGMRGRRVPVGFIHDDFHYSNVLVMADGRVCAIDNAGNYQSSIYADLATLITDPQTRSLQVALSGHAIAPDFIESCKKAILDEYFKGEEYDEKALNFHCALAILNKWSEGAVRFSNGWGKKMRPVVMWAIQPYFSKILFRYL